jgi:hypothetical protein
MKARDAAGRTHLAPRYRRARPSEDRLEQVTERPDVEEVGP